MHGNNANLFSSVNGSIWVKGGSIEYSEMHEAAPYWLYVIPIKLPLKRIPHDTREFFSNAIVPLAFQLPSSSSSSSRLIAQVKDFLDWNLSNQGSDGWIGPEKAQSGVTRLVWPRYLVLLGLIVCPVLSTFSLSILMTEFTAICRSRPFTVQ
jgi:hypothetical protein